MIKTRSNLNKNLQKPYRSLRKTNGKQMNTMENQRTALKKQRKPKENLRCPGLFLGAEDVKYMCGCRGLRRPTYARLTRSLRVLTRRQGHQAGPRCSHCVFLICVPTVFPTVKVSYLRPCGGGSEKTSSSPNLKSTTPKKKT